MIIDCNSVSLSRGKKTLLDDANARIGSQYKVGLVGRNGAGKSSFIRLLKGELQEDGGNVSMGLTPDRIVSLEQSLPDSDDKAIEYAKSGDRTWYELQKRLLAAEHAGDGLAIAECHAGLHDIDGYSMDARATKVCLGLGFSSADLQRPVSSFSGGWQMRLQLARVLLADADLLLLDEPTNHLDIDAIIWLERWLNSANTTVVLISHDRDFLDGVCTHTLHLSEKKLKLYQGNYSAFSKQYELQLEIQSREQEKLQVQRAHMQSFVDRFRAKASKAKQAQSRMKALEKLVSEPGMQRENPFHFNFLPCDMMKGSVLNMDASVGYDGNPIVKDIRFNLDYGDRVGLVGRNGQGKTTIMKSLAGSLPLVEGEVYRHPKIQLAYFSQQQQDMLDSDSTPLQQLLRVDPKLAESTARQFLGGFDFSGERVFDSVGSFSGGERARLALALLIYQKPNLLLLDEPTNHMDMQMREAFVMALQQFEGAVVLVSHDRYFMNGVVNDVACVEKGVLVHYQGNIEDYRQRVLQSDSDTTVDSCIVNQKSDRSLLHGVTHQKIRKIEAKIQRASDKVLALSERLADASLYEDGKQDELEALTLDHKSAVEKLDALEEEWFKMQVE